MDRSGSQDHFFLRCDIHRAAAAHDADAHASSPFEIQLHYRRIEKQSEVRPRQRRIQESASGAHARPIRGDVHVDVAGARDHRPIHVVENGHAHLASRVEEGRRRGMRILGTANVDGAARTPPRICASLPILLTLEHRKHVGERPAFGSALRPTVIIPLHAAGPHHRIDAAPAAQHVTKRHVEGAIVQPRRWLDGQVIVERPSDVVKPDTRVRHRRRVVRPSRLDNQNPRAGGGQFRGQNRTGRSCPHHDEVIYVVHS